MLCGLGIQKINFIELQTSHFYTLYLYKTCTFCFWSPYQTSHSFKQAVSLPYSSTSLRKRLQLYIEPYCQTRTIQRSKSWSWTWHFWFKFPTPPGQWSNSPLPENKWWSYAQVCPGGCWSFELIGAFKLGQLTLWALGVISIKFLLVISMLCKTAWSWELRTRSHKMNFLDILSTSLHYFCRKWIGGRNENLNLDLRV